MVILSQRDSRWKQSVLGFSKTSTIGDYGCTITCIASAAELSPQEVNDRLKKVNGFKDDLVIWQKIKDAIPWLEFEWRGYSYDNNRVLNAIEKNGFCLVEVDFDGKISTPRDRHWVLYLGDKKMMDPWTGVIKSTSYYPIVTGYCVINRITPTPVEPPVENPAPNEDEKRALTILRSVKESEPDLKSGNLEGAVNALVSAYRNLPPTVTAKATLESFRDGIAKQLRMDGQRDTSIIATELAKVIEESDNHSEEAAQGVSLFEVVANYTNGKTWIWPKEVPDLISRFKEKISQPNPEPITTPPADIEIHLFGLKFQISKIKGGDTK